MWGTLRGARAPVQIQRTRTAAAHRTSHQPRTYPYPYLRTPTCNRSLTHSLAHLHSHSFAHLRLLKSAASRQNPPPRFPIANPRFPRARGGLVPSSSAPARPSLLNPTLVRPLPLPSLRLLVTFRYSAIFIPRAGRRPRLLPPRSSGLQAGARACVCARGTRKRTMVCIAAEYVLYFTVVVVVCDSSRNRCRRVRVLYSSSLSLCGRELNAERLCRCWRTREAGRLAREYACVVGTVHGIKPGSR